MLPGLDFEDLEATSRLRGNPSIVGCCRVGFENIDWHFCASGSFFASSPRGRSFRFCSPLSSFLKAWGRDLGRPSLKRLGFDNGFWTSRHLVLETLRGGDATLPRVYLPRLVEALLDVIEIRGGWSKPMSCSLKNA